MLNHQRVTDYNVNVCLKSPWFSGHHIMSNFLNMLDKWWCWVFLFKCSRIQSKDTWIYSTKSKGIFQDLLIRNISFPALWISTLRIRKLRVKVWPFAQFLKATKYDTTKWAVNHQWAILPTRHLASYPTIRMSACPRNLISGKLERQDAHLQTPDWKRDIAPANMPAPLCHLHQKKKHWKQEHCKMGTAQHVITGHIPRPKKGVSKDHEANYPSEIDKDISPLKACMFTKHPVLLEEAARDHPPPIFWNLSALLAGYPTIH